MSSYSNPTSQIDPSFSQDQWQNLIFWYLSVEQGTINELEIALAEEDFHRLIVLGEQIYGHASSFGFERISFFGKKIELAAIDKNTILLRGLISSLKTYIKYLLQRTERIF